MRVIGVCGSPRFDGNTELLIDTALDIIEQTGVKTRKVLLAGKTILGCKACMKCRERKDGICHGRNDDLTPIFADIYAADGLLLGTPVYFGAATAEIVAFIDRIGYVSRQNGGLLNGKVGAALVVARRAGQNFTLAQLNYFFLINGMIIPGASYWPIAFGGPPKDVINDDEGMKTCRDLARNVARLVNGIVA